MSPLAGEQIMSIAVYMADELLLSEQAIIRYTDRINVFIMSLSAPVNYQKCRFKAWRALGWRCMIFEKQWVIAYEDFTEGVIIRDIKHTKLMK
jgi:hypothetical protein